MAVLTEEQTLLRDSARTWTRDKSPVTAFRKMRDSGAPLGYDPAAFAEMAEMGWTGVIIPEEYGGSDFGYLGLGLILEETGRTLTASPILSTALAAASAIVMGGPRRAEGNLAAPRSPPANSSPPWPSTKARTTGRTRSRPWRPRAATAGRFPARRSSCSKAWRPAC